MAYVEALQRVLDGINSDPIRNMAQGADPDCVTDVVRLQLKKQAEATKPAGPSLVCCSSVECVDAT